MKEVDIRPERECKYTKFFHSAQTGCKNIVSGRDLSLSLRKTGAVRAERGRAERETTLVKRRVAWIQRGRLGNNRAGLSKRRAGFGKQGAACITGGALRTQRDGMDNKVRHGQNKVRHGQNRKQIFVLSPAFHYLCGETDAGPAGRMPGKFCADTHLRTVCAVFAINLRL